MKKKSKASMRSKARAILSQYHALKERRYVGDLDASDTLIDFERAVKMARLTHRQAEALSLVYGADLTQKDAGERMGIGQNTVSELVADGSAAIDEVYEAWAWIDGELTQEDEETEVLAV